MVAEFGFEWAWMLLEVFDVSGYTLLTLGHPLAIGFCRLFFAHAAEAQKKRSSEAEFYFVIFNFCDAVLIDAEAILRFGRNVNEWVVYFFIMSKNTY